jgi:asparagine synthase (glutamine-hydrolysing)
MVYYQHYQHLPAWLRKSNATLAGVALRDSANGQLWPQRIRRFLEGGASSFSDCYLSFLTVVDGRKKRDLYTPEFEEALASSDTMDFIRPYLESENGIPSLERMMFADVNTYLPFNQLVYGDRMSMAQSLEIRVPFVDQKLTQVTSGIPLQWKMQGGVTKGLFREAMASYLPKEVLKAPKRGLNLPIALWFREDLRSWVRSLLSPERLKSRGYLRPEEVEKLLTEHESGRRDHSLFIWALIVLELWHQQYMD